MLDLYGKTETRKGEAESGFSMKPADGFESDLIIFEEDSIIKN